MGKQKNDNKIRTGLDELRRQLADDRLAVIKYFNNVGL